MGNRQGVCSSQLSADFIGELIRNVQRSNHPPWVLSETTLRYGQDSSQLPLCLHLGKVSEFVVHYESRNSQHKLISVTIGMRKLLFKIPPKSSSEPNTASCNLSPSVLPDPLTF